jgi:hypothetical protein
MPGKFSPEGAYVMNKVIYFVLAFLFSYSGVRAQTTAAGLYIKVGEAQIKKSLLALFGP